ncbi:NHL domain-containing protein [Lysobacter fragariae]
MRSVVGLCVKASLLVLLSGSWATAMAQQFNFQTIAGGVVGDGGPATSANVANPVGVARDGQGNIYITQFYENRIRRVSAVNGTITTLAGNGTPGFGGDGGVASAATVNAPAGMVIDGTGAIYFVDMGNSRVRKIAPNGVITTIAGNGTKGNSGDGGAATSASLGYPYGLAIDASGNLYISDVDASVVRKVTPAGTISTVAGNGTAGYSGDGGAATAAILNHPEGLAVDAAGNLYIADTSNSRIRQVTPAGVITTVVGTGVASSSGDGGPATEATLFYPRSVAVDPLGRLLVSDGYCSIRRVEFGIINVYAGDKTCNDHGDGIPAISAGFSTPEGMAVDSEGGLIFADPDLGRILYISGPYPDSIIFTVAGAGTFAGDGGPATAAVLSRPQGVAVDTAGNVFVADTFFNQRVRRIAPNGTIDTAAGNGDWFAGDGPATQVGIGYVKGLTVDATGALYLADYGNNRVYQVVDGYLRKYAGTGASAYGGDGGSAANAGMDPHGVVMDAGGNLYISDGGNHRVRKVTPAGLITTIAGNGTAGFSGDGGPATSASLNNPTALALDTKGNLYISDYYNRRVRKVTPDGIITTVAGNGEAGGGGDGGLATSAQLYRGTGLAVDLDGTVYIAGGTLRRVTPAGIIESVPGWVHSAAGVALDGFGDIYVTTNSGRVIKGTRPRPVADDFDGDRRADLFWRNGATGQNAIWRSAASTSQQAVTAQGDVNWKIAATDDFNGDGKADVVWRNEASGANTLWYSASATTVQTLSTVSDLNWKIVGAGDFDGDGKADLLWRNSTTGANSIWKSASYANRQTLASVASAAWIVAGVGDFNADRRADIVWRNTSTGVNTVWFSANFATSQNLTAVTNQQWKIVGVGDFDGDRKSDLLWRNGTTGANTIWKSALSTRQQAITGVTDQAWIVAATGDYNGDGNSDLVWRNASTGGNALWYSASTATKKNLVTVSPEWKVAP